MNASSQTGSKSLPLLVLTALLVVCGLAVVMQWRAAKALKQENTALRAATEELTRLRDENAELGKLRAESQEMERLKADQQELLRLRNEVRQLRQQSTELQKIRSDNQRLQTQLTEQSAAARSATAQAATALAVTADARRKAESVACVNNLKQLGLAGRIWAKDHNNVMPADFISMRAELNTPRILICPGDTTKAHLFDASGNPGPALLDWNAFGPQNISYQMVSPGVPENSNPQTVFARCPYHGHQCHLDGSVLQAQSAQ